MDEQIIKAALKDGNMPLAQAAAYRLLLWCAERISAMENLEKEEASGGRSAATPSPDQSSLDPRVEEISRGHDGKWRAYGRGWITGQIVYLGESDNLADLVGVNDKAYIMLGELQIENSKLRGHAEALERQVAEMHSDWRLQEREAQVAALTAEKNEALNEVRRLREENRWLETELDSARLREHGWGG